MRRNRSQVDREKCKNPEKTSVSRGSNALKVAGTGFEQPHQSLGKTAFQGADNAECNALAAGDVEIDSDLELIIRAWPDLSESVRMQLVYIIKESRKTDF
ncbi:MAG: hypothetical protein ABIK07_12085 [Planctomycetota bacterium]